MNAVSRLAWVLLVLALTSAAASLLASHHFWWGMDVGTAGTVVFGFTLWFGAWLYAKQPDRIFSAEWAIAERRSWVGLTFVALIFANFVHFFWALSQYDETPPTLGDIPLRHLAWNLFVLLISWCVVADALKGREAGVIERDERDLRFQNAAERVGDWTFTTIVIACVATLVVVPAEKLGWWLAPLIVANLLVGLLILKSLAEYAYLVSRYAWERR